MSEIKAILLALTTDCGGTDVGRYMVGVSRTFYPHTPTVAFFATESQSTQHAGFVATAHALSTIDMFGPLKEGERVGVMINAAPREKEENGKALRGHERSEEGEDVFLIKMKNGVWVVGPNAGMNFYFLPKTQIEATYVLGGERLKTPFRSLELMIPALSKALGVQEFDDIRIREKELVVPTPNMGVFVGDWDSHGNIYLFSTTSDDSWIPPLEKSVTIHINSACIRVRHVNGIFAGHTGEPTLTTGSLKLNGKNVHYLVVVGGDAHGLFRKPPVGAKVRFDS